MKTDGTESDNVEEMGDFPWRPPEGSESALSDLLCCPCCESKRVDMERNDSIFHGQNYSDRYPPEAAKQNHGFRARCGNCGLQTCWWHYKQEVVTYWNGRPT